MMEKEKETLVALVDVSKSFPGVRALNKVKLNLKAGEVIGLLGENGAGKSTLMKILSGVIQKDEGEIRVKGDICEFASPKEAEAKGIAIIHQELNLCKHLTVAENIFLTREDTAFGWLNKKETNQKAQQILNQLGLNIKPTDVVGDLQVSKQQMVEICKALSIQADIIIMDEPTSALTEKEIDELFAVINQLKADGKGIIYISHRLEELVHIVDRVTVLRDGEYITTLDYHPEKLPEVISHMVGRQIKDKFPRIECEIGETVFEVEHLTTKTGVKDATFHVRAGEIVGFAGLMGAGRTELMRAIFGADKKVTGTIKIKGQTVNIKTPKDAISNGLYYVPEDRKKDGLCIKMLVQNNITLPNLDRTSKGEWLNGSLEKELTQTMIDKLSIKTPSKDQKVKNLSGGNQQKIVVGKWLAREANILIFDEPTRGIDVAAKIEIYELINQLKSQGIGIICVSSELPEVLGISDRIYVMCNGRIKADLSMKETNQEEIIYYATQYDTVEEKS